MHGRRSGPIVSLPRKDVWGRRPRVRERPTRGPSRQIRKYVHEILECETCMYLASYFFGSSWLVCQGLINKGSVLESSRENALIVVLFSWGAFTAGACTNLVSVVHKRAKRGLFLDYSLFSFKHILFHELLRRTTARRHSCFSNTVITWFGREHVSVH